MNIKNIGSKIVNIGTIVLMPGDSVTLDSKWNDVPAIRSLVDHGFLAVEAVENKKPELWEGAEDEANISELEAKEEVVEVPERRLKRRGNR